MMLFCNLLMERTQPDC